MSRLEHDDRTISSAKRGHLTSVICGQPTSALTAGYIDPCGEGAVRDDGCVCRIRTGHGPREGTGRDIEGEGERETVGKATIG